MVKQTINYKIKLYSYWHTGGKESDKVLKDKDGLPYIPGRTIKGLIKDAANYVKMYQPTLVNQDFIDTVFGVEDMEYGKDDNGNNHFKSMVLNEDINKDNIHLLYHQKHSTALESGKQAKKHALRTTEVTIPCVLEGSIENFDGNIEMLKYSFQALKKLGENRFRGLGRCILELTTQNE